MNEILLFQEYGLQWVKEERAARYALGRPLNAEELAALNPFFTAQTLAAARIQHVYEVPNPGFYAMLPGLGIPIPLDFRQMWGQTFIDCILIAESKVGKDQLPWRLLFHELVHVVQYRLLGVEEFVRRYVQGWAQNDRDYNRIPIEVQAYALDAQYEANPVIPFSVEAVVRAQPPR